MQTKQAIFTEIEKKATVHQSQGLSKAAAVAKVAEDNPNLYVAYCDAPVGDPKLESPARMTVAQFVSNLLAKKAERIQKTRNLSGADAYFEALRENPKLVEAARNPQFASEYVDNMV